MKISKYSVTDYSEKYKPLMQFNRNKNAFIHQWYPFVEGYSREFIYEVLNEINYHPRQALDPFAGSGTTPVELQYLGITCHSFEVSPFMHLLATVKMHKGYRLKDFDRHLQTFRKKLYRFDADIRRKISPPAYQRIERKPGLEKWAFNRAVMDALLKLKFHLDTIDDVYYRNLFRIAMASILLDVSNLYRNGKCLSYKDDWQTKRPGEQTVFRKYFDRLENVIRPDIEEIEKYVARKGIISDNIQYCHHGDARKQITSLTENNIDLVITSPPYLNSRDYTDIYMIELWMLDLVQNYEQVRSLRKSTIRSHVQVVHGEVQELDIPLLKTTMAKLSRNKQDHWDRGLSSMIKGYFVDMDGLFAQLKLKMQKQKYVFFNIANSAYYGVEIKVDEIVAEIAERRGFRVREIREARKLKPSVQQKDQIPFLRESVIVMRS